MATFFSWLENRSTKVSEKDAALYGSLEKIWNASACPGIETPDVETQWQRLSKQMETAPAAQPRFRASYAYACAFAAVIMLFMTWQFRSEGASFTTELAQTMTLALPDHSTVTLTADSNLVYEPQFNRTNRDVSLQGEAFFSVESGKLPFVVHTGFARIQVVGTQFNVHARQDLVEVSVIEGVVEVNADLADGQNQVTLRAGEKIVLSPQTKVETAAKEVGYSGWLEGQLDLEAAPASRVCQEIERRFNVTVRLANPEWASTEVSGLFKNDPESMVQSLSMMLERTYVVENGAYIIQ